MENQLKAQTDWYVKSNASGFTSIGIYQAGIQHSIYRQKYKTGKVSLIKKLKFISFFLFLFHAIYADGQHLPLNKDNFTFEIPKTSSAIKIDGILDEPEWEYAGKDTTFWLHYPVDSGYAYAKTEVRMMYDNKNLYIGFISYNSPDKPVVQSLKRDDDNNTNNSDGMIIVMDPSNTSKNGYYFSVNAAGAQQDGTVSQNGIYPTIITNWNNKWYAEVSKSNNSVYYEIAIPFGALKYDNENVRWAINFLRRDVGRNVTYAWTRFPANHHDLDLGYTGTLVFRDELIKGKSNQVVLMPSVTTDLNRNAGNIENTKKAGLDARISVNSSLNLDMTVNPDFSNVAVDKQYIDFYRFEYYQPEQRSFFLENNDLIASFGSHDDFSTPADEKRVKPVYTRRIGMKAGNNIPIIYGARLSGAAFKDTRVCLLNLGTESIDGMNAQNYLVGSFQKGIFKRSAIKGLFTSRNAIEQFSYLKNDYNRTGGLEFDYSSQNGRWSANAKLHASYTPENYSDNLFYGGGLSYMSKVFKTQNLVERVGSNYITDIGFVPRLYYKDAQRDTIIRKGYTHLVNKFELYQFLNNDWFIVMGEYTNIHNYLNENNKLNEFSFDLGYWGVFKNNSHVILQGTYNKFDLLVPHNVLNNDNPVPVGTYKNRNLYFFYETDKRKKMKYDVTLEKGDFYDGTKSIFKTSTTYTIQPYATIALSYNLTDINLKKNLGQATYNLVGLNPEISFSKKLTWANLVQYNTQLKNINFNSMFQWRYAPMSDLYFVFKDDATLSGKNKRYEVSFKLTYWLGI